MSSNYPHPLIAREGPLAAAVALTGLALDAGGRDNITAVCIPVSPTSARPHTDGPGP